MTSAPQSHCSPERNPADRRTMLVASVIAAAFLLAYAGARAGLRHAEPGTTAALLFALLPVPFFLLMVVYYVRMIRQLDELARRIHLEALAIAFPCALLVAFTAGLLDRAGFHGGGNYDLPHLWPLLLLPYWIGLAIAKRRYC